MTSPKKSPITAAAASPLPTWRDAIYIAAGFAGIIAVALMLFQPLLIGGYLPGLSAPKGPRVYFMIGGGVRGGGRPFPCGLIVVTAAKALLDQKPWAGLTRRRR